MMQRQLILSSLLIVAAINNVFGQKIEALSNTINLDTVKTNKTNNIFVGIDASTPIQSIYSDKSGLQGFVSYQFKQKWVAIAELGFEKNKFNENSWKVDVDGIYGKIGLNWFINQDPTNILNGFYVGGRFAYSSFNQTLNEFPIRDIYSNTIVDYGNLPKSKVSSYWVEVVVGGRVELYKNLYADFSIHPAIYLGGKKQNNIDHLVIPGYGRNNGPFNLPLFFGISYKLL